MPRSLARVAGLTVLLACAPKPSAEPDPPETPAPAATIAEAEPTPSPEAPAAGEDPSAPLGPDAPVEPVTGIPACDEYLALYRRCEARLEPEIMAGDRRFYRAERAALEVAVASPEAPTLPDACAAMLAELQPRCAESSGG